MTEEIWKAVPEFPGYEVSNFGRLKSFRKSAAGRIIVGRKRSGPGNRKALYHSVQIKRDGEAFFFFMQRLVLTAFVGPCPPKHEACHDDGNSLHNAISNLRWGTKQENVEDAIRHGKMIGLKAGIKHHSAKLWDEAIRCIRAEPGFPGVNSVLAGAFGVSKAQIIDIRAGRYWKHVPQWPTLG